MSTTISAAYLKVESLTVNGTQAGAIDSANLNVGGEFKVGGKLSASGGIETVIHQTLNRVTDVIGAPATVMGSRKVAKSPFHLPTPRGNYAVDLHNIVTWRQTPSSIVVKKSKIDFVTLLIGVNDWVRGVDTAMFAQNFAYILNEIEKEISNKKQILIITIPDFGVTPTGARYSGGRDISKGITEFNSIILNEAAKRNLKIVDIFELSKGMNGDDSLVAKDGLHPSANEYALWEKLILPVATNLLEK